MMQIEKQLKKYHQLAQAIREVSDVETLGKSDEFLEMIDIEENILGAYGLPFGRPYQTILEDFGFENSINQRKIIRVIGELKNHAIHFHHAPVESNEQILCWGKENYKSFDYVLPLMGFTTTSYIIFLYTELWRRKHYPVKEIVREMKLAQGFNKEVNIACSDSNHITLSSRLLKKAGAKYANEFKAYIKKERLPKALIKDIDRNMHWLFGNEHVPEILELDKYYIESLHFHSNDDGDIDGEVDVFVYSMYANMWQQYEIAMSVRELQQMLLQCTQTELADLMNSYADDYKRMQKGYEHYISIRDDKKTYLECNALLDAALVKDVKAGIPSSQYNLLSLGNP